MWEKTVGTEDIVTPLPDGTYRHEFRSPIWYGSETVPGTPVDPDLMRRFIASMTTGASANVIYMRPDTYMALKLAAERGAYLRGMARNRQRARQWAQRPRNVKRRRRHGHDHP
jgi:hypothetical protein